MESTQSTLTKQDIQLLNALYAREKQPIPTKLLLLNSNTKQQVNGILLHAKLTLQQTIRYTFTDGYLDLRIPTKDELNGYRDFNYKNTIDKAYFLTNTPVILSYVEYKPGMQVLLNICYEAFDHKEAVTPMDAADRKTITQITYKSFWLYLALGGGISLVYGLLSGFKTFDAFHPLIFFAILFLYPVYLAWKQKSASNRRIIQTTITEVLTLSMEDSLTQYRLADGTILPASGKMLKPGDTVSIMVAEHHDGTDRRLVQIQTT
ncbi:hypothetical protein SAMN05428949_0304 [Chitinophaga sp. YR627]|uniref:hypothetical protein n=1 Tax=Chitinophaga sp. YR627 TaxID=1881041 RepID=UPI0008F2BE25|nr:hypothetical protein [Chitinophaga sp. YR627]SFM65022.1 hypothetical protein SAMN05428949_0304 [Chitinophaga sp. YR627]